MKAGVALGVGKAEIRHSFSEHLSLKNITEDEEGHYIMIRDHSKRKT